MAALCILNARCGLVLASIRDHAALTPHDLFALAHNANRDTVAFKTRQRVDRQEPALTKFWGRALPFRLCLRRKPARRHRTTARGEPAFNHFELRFASLHGENSHFQKYCARDLATVPTGFVKKLETTPSVG